MPPVYGDTAATLIVDDDPATAAALTHILAQEGYRCHVAPGAAAARAALEETDFALALVDVVMPGETGLELVADLGAEHPHLAVVMVTAVDDPSIAELALTCGVYGYVIKPFRAAQVAITAHNASIRRCAEIDTSLYAAGLQGAYDDQAADLDAARADLADNLERGGGGRPHPHVQHPATIHSDASDGDRPPAALLDTALLDTALLDAIPAAIIVETLDGTITGWNLEAERLYGHSTTEMVGQRMDPLIPEHRRADETVVLARASAGERVRSYQTERLRADGTTVTVLLSVGSLYGPAGAPVGVVRVASTVAKRPEAQRGRERPQALTERDRSEKTRHLQSLGQLADGVAHDLNNLMCVIMSYASFTKEKVAAAAAGATSQDWAAAVRHTAEIEQAADRAVELARQLAATARPETARPGQADRDTPQPGPAPGPQDRKATSS